MKLFKKRSKVRLVNTIGYVRLAEACVRANQTGFFGLSQRVAPESFDGENTNIDPRECFFGGRRIDLALAAKTAEDFANKSTKQPAPAADGAESVSGSDSQT